MHKDVNKMTVLEKRAVCIKEDKSEHLLDETLKEALNGQQLTIKHFNKKISVVSTHKLSAVEMFVLDALSDALEGWYEDYPIVGKEGEVCKLLDRMDIGGYAICSNKDYFSRRDGRIIAKLRLLDKLTTREVRSDASAYDEYMPLIKTGNYESGEGIGEREEVERIIK